jgi:Replication-relaxation
LYAASSLGYVRRLLKSLVAAHFVFALGGKAVNLPLIYTLSGVGRTYTAAMGLTPRKRFRPAEEAEKSHNPYFMKHTIAVTDVLIAAHRLAETVPAIRLTRMYTERDLKRKISVQLTQRIGEGKTRLRTCYLEPDAGLLFRMTETWHKEPETWEDFFFIEVYRNLPPVEWRFKQKVQGYVATVDTGRHEALFHTPALSIAIIAQTGQMATTLKRWTEEALQEMKRQAEGEWFFFCSLDTAAATPEEMFLSPVWEQAFSITKTPLLILEGDGEQHR